MEQQPSHSPYRFIDLGSGHIAIVDRINYDWLMKYKWRAVKAKRCWYAKTTVGVAFKKCDLSMHRLVANTPSGMICHHRNQNSLDNRRANLANWERYIHELHHRNNSLVVQYAPDFSPDARSNQSPRPRGLRHVDRAPAPGNPSPASDRPHQKEISGS